MLEEDAQALRGLAKKSKDYREVQRLRALYALSVGTDVPTVAKVFDVDESIVYDWITWWISERGLGDAPRSGRPPELSAEDKGLIRKLVEENDPKKSGVNASARDCAEFVKYFARRGRAVSDEVVRNALQEMGAHYVKAVIEYTEADERERREFARSFLRDLRGKNGTLVLFEDEMSAELSARKGYDWTLKKRLVVRAPQARRQRLNLFGAVSPFSGEVIQMASRFSKAGAFVRFLNKISVAHPRRRVWVYVDNYRLHFCKAVGVFLKRHPNIRLKRLPKYSPELNPREYWHGFLRKKLLNNTSFDSLSALRGAVHAFTRRVPRAVVRSVCSLEPIYALAK